VPDCGTRRLGVLINTAVHCVQTGDKERGNLLSHLAVYCTSPEHVLRHKPGLLDQELPCFLGSNDPGI